MSSILKCAVIAVLACAVSQNASAQDALQHARSLLENGQVGAAGQSLETYLNQHPRSADGWALLGVVRAQQADNTSAEECFHKALSILPHLTSAQTNLGHLLLSEHRAPEALPYLSAALQSEPRNGEVRDMMVAAAEETALQERARGDRNGALATLLAAKVQVPHEFRLLLDLSILEDEARLLRDAERDVAEARAIRPEDLKALYAEARVKLDLQEMPAAEKDMRAYLKARPDDATAHYGLGRILQMTQRSDEAKAEFGRSIALAPNQAESYYQIGQMALDHGDFAIAQQVCRKALEHDPKHGGALTALGIAAYRLKQYPEAVQALQQAIAAAPEYQTAHYYYGLALAKNGQKEASARELKLAAAMADEQNRREAQHLQLAPDAATAAPRP